MKKVLLVAINAKYIHSNLAVYSLKKHAGKYGEFVEIAEFTINHQVDYILSEIYKKKPKILAVSCYIWNIDIVREVLKELSKVLPEMKIWVGGPEVSYDAKNVLLQADYIDGVMIGEGEATFYELMKYYIEEYYSGEYGSKKSSFGECDFQELCSLESIDGIAFRKNQKKVRNKREMEQIEEAFGDEVVMTPLRKPINMGELAFPYDDIEQFENKIIYYETSRGCPYSCSYCLSSIEKGVRLRPFSMVREELQLFLDHKIPQVKFIDRTFNCNHNHAMKIWSYIKEHDNGITNFHFEISADILKEDELELLNSMREGLVQLEIGVQSTNAKTIEAIHRKMDLEKLKYTVARVAEGNNIHQHLDLIAGLPYEDYISFRTSFNDVYAMEPNQLQLGFLKVLKGSLMKEESEKYGISFKESAPYEVLFSQWLSYDDILRLKKVEDMVEIYYNSDQFANSVKYLLHFFETPFDFYQALGNYYEEKHLQGMNHSRARRYEILREFAKEMAPKASEVLDVLLVYDLYLRENLKSRPFYAKDQQQEKAIYREFYQNEENISKYLQGYEKYQPKQILRMTHMEHVWIDIAKTVATGETVWQEAYLLFDYQRKSKLTQEAYVTVLKPEEVGI